jgi:hypothetical protein
MVQRNKLLVELAVACTAVQAGTPHSESLRTPSPSLPSSAFRHSRIIPSRPTTSRLSLGSWFAFGTFSVLIQTFFLPRVRVGFDTGSWSVLTRFLFCPFFSSSWLGLGSAEDVQC